MWQVCGFALGRWLRGMSSEGMQGVARHVMDLLVQGVLVPLSGKSFPLDQCWAAVEEAERPGRVGKALTVG